MASAPAGKVARYCVGCGQPLAPGAPSCPLCGTPTTRPAPRRRLSARADKWVFRGCVAAAVVGVAVLVALAVVPVAQRAQFNADLPVLELGPGGCGHSIFWGWSFPAGKAVHLTWTTNPATDIALQVNTTQGSNQTEVLSETGSAGNATLYSTGDAYGFDVHNCQNQSTTMTFSAYYDFNAPLL